MKDTGAEDSIEMLESLIEGKRLKDISDLPLDLKRMMNPGFYT